MNKVFLIVIGLLLISFASAGTYDDCEVYGTCKPISTTTSSSTNYSTINVNNTEYLQGYTPTTLKDWIQSLFDNIYCKLTGCTMTGNLISSANISSNRFQGYSNSSYGIWSNSTDTVIGYIGGLS